LPDEKANNCGEVAKLSKPKRAFTLVEILLVIFIIGILAGSLLLSMGASRDRSAATRIVSDLMTLKRTAMLFFSDNGRWPDESDYDRLNSYLTGRVQLQPWDEDSGRYAIRRQETLGTVYAAVRVTDEFGGSPRIRELLERDSSKYDLLNEELTPYQSHDLVVAVRIKDAPPGYDEDGEDDSTSSEGSGGDSGQNPGSDPGGGSSSGNSTWDSEKAYLMGDRVEYNGKVFEARYWTKGNQPGLKESPWQEITDEWRDFNEYNEKDIVVYDGKRYEALYWSKGQTPGEIHSPWQQIDTDQWVVSNRYYQGDTVFYNGKQYRAKWNIDQGESPPGSTNAYAWELIG
jgi:prepilin-type N-terminal cleavage/methylation domain-containing protein